MAEMTETQEQESGSSQGEGTNGSDIRRTALRAAAIAAASGVTAIAAKKAFSSQPSSTGGKQSGSGSNGGSSQDSSLTGMLESGWNAARDSLVPFAAQASTAAGEYLGRNGPDVVCETIVPAFIDGFERAQSSEQK